MPIENIKCGEVYFNGVCVGVSHDIEITDYTEDKGAVKEYLREQRPVVVNRGGTLQCTIKFNFITYLKLCGLWDWVKTNCPNKRLVYLMDHGKNTRVRLKNYRRAAHEIGKYIK